MKAIERFYKYIDYKGYKPTSIEKEIGLSSGYLSVQKKRKADMGETIVNKINDYCIDLDIEWLLTGKGSMLKESDNKSVNQSMIGNNSQMVGGKVVGSQMENNSNKSVDYQSLINAINELKKQVKAKDNMINNLMKQQDTLLSQISKLTDKLSN